MLHGAEVKVLSSEMFKPPSTVEFSSIADQALLWILGKQNEHFVPSLKGKLAFADRFLERKGGHPHDTIIHAETALAQFFYLHELQFVFQDRYIGCSKPSCYACSIYLSKHPGNFVQRPSHGNAWFRWYPPRSTSGSDARMTDKVLREMILHMEADLRKGGADFVSGKDLGRRQPFESTTGIETTIRRLHDVLLFGGTSRRP